LRKEKEEERLPETIVVRAVGERAFQREGTIELKNLD